MKSKINWEANELNYYLGGIFDAKGTVRIYPYMKITKGKKHKSHILSISICSFKKEALELFKQSFGGALRKHGGTNPFGIKFRAGWNWIVRRKVALEFLEIIRPYLLEKLPQVDIAIKFQQLMSNRGAIKITPQVRATRMKLRRELKKLK